MAPESSLLTAEIGILVWLTAGLSAVVWWSVENLVFDALHRQRYGTYKSEFWLMLDILRQPRAIVSVISRDQSARMHAFFDPADDRDVERQRRVMFAAFATMVVAMFAGVVVVFVVADVLRAILPGTLVTWAAIADLLMLAAWARSASLASRASPRSGIRADGTRVGVVICVLSLVALAVLWQTGGVRL